MMFVLIGSISLLLSACSKPTEGNEEQPPAAPKVSVAKVIVRDITPWEEFTGRIEAKEIVQIRPRVGGVIQSIHYDEGDMVSKGDLLFVIDKQPFEAELKRAEAELSRARAQATLTRAEITRAKDLLKRKLLSQDEYDQRVAARDQAIATMNSAEASLQIARLNLSYTEVRSPIDGRTGRALVTEGNLVASSTAPTPDLLTTVLSMDPVYVMFDSDELTYLNFFDKPQQSTITDTNNRRKVLVGLGNEEGFQRQGYVNFIDNRVDPDTGTINMRAVLENKDYRLTPGLFARVKLLASRPVQAILINEKAILTDQDRKYVYVINDEHKAMRRDIKIGRATEGLRIVTAGLEPGEQVIVYGIQQVFFPGMQVDPQTIGMSDPPAPAGQVPATTN